jgi:hypothetical protein
MCHVFMEKIKRPKRNIPNLTELIISQLIAQQQIAIHRKTFTCNTSYRGCNDFDRVHEREIILRSREGCFNSKIK